MDSNLWGLGHISEDHWQHDDVIIFRVTGHLCWEFTGEMECVLFYSRKIAHRANIICYIMYPTLNKFYLILSYDDGEHFSR